MSTPLKTENNYKRDNKTTRHQDNNDEQDAQNPGASCGRCEKAIPGIDVDEAMAQFTEEKLDKDLKKTRKPRALPDDEERCIARIWELLRTKKGELA